MATEAERQRVRLFLNEPDDTNGWTDARIDDLLVATANPDGTFDYRASASSGWEQKAAYASTLVSISENGSSRQSQQVFDHALAMAKLYMSSGSDDTGTGSLLRPRSTRIVRPTRG